MHINENAVRIAVLHTFVEFNAKKKNMDRISDAIKKVLHYEERVRMIVLPQMINGIAAYEEIARKGIKISGETIPGPFTDGLINISRMYGADLLAGPILERRGSKLYRSSTFISGSEVKRVIRQVMTGGRVSGHKEIPYIDLDNLGIGIYIADDMFYPEIALILSILNPNVTIFFPRIGNDIAKQQIIAKARTVESKNVAIMVGGIYMYKQEILAVIPTVVIDEEGDEIERVDKVDERIIVLNVNPKQRSNAIIANERKKLLKTLKKLLH